MLVSNLCFSLFFLLQNFSFTTVSAALLYALLKNISARPKKEVPASHLQHQVLYLRGRKSCSTPSSKRDVSIPLPLSLAGYLLLTKKVPFSSPTSSLVQNIEPKSQEEIAFHLRGRKSASRLLICRLCIFAKTSCFLDVHLLRGRNISDQNLKMVMIAVVSFIKDRSIPIQDLYSTQECLMVLLVECLFQASLRSSRLCFK